MGAGGGGGGTASPARPGGRWNGRSMPGGKNGCRPGWSNEVVGGSSGLRTKPAKWEGKLIGLNSEVGSCGDNLGDSGREVEVTGGTMEEESEVRPSGKLSDPGSGLMAELEALEAWESTEGVLGRDGGNRDSGGVCPNGNGSLGMPSRSRLARLKGAGDEDSPVTCLFKCGSSFSFSVKP